MNIFKIIREIYNYFFLLFQLSKAKKTAMWKKLDLHIGYIGQVWTVVNLKKEDMGEDIKVQAVYVRDRFRPISEFLYKYELGELLYTRIKKIDNTYGWLVIYWPYFRYISLGLVLRWVVALVLMYVLYTHTNLWDGIVLAYNTVWDWMAGPVWDWVSSLGIFKR